jgi:hypothetical protein
MIKYIIIGLGAILGLFLIYKLIRTPKIYKKWAVYNKVRITMLIIALSLGGIVALTYYLGSNNGVPKSEILDIIQNLNSHKINHIELFSYSKSFSNYQDNDTLVIYDQAIKDKISLELNKLSSIEQSSSASISWQVKMRIVLEEELLNNIVFDISKMKNGDCFFWLMKKTWFGDFNLGLFKDNELGNVLEKIPTHLDTLSIKKGIKLKDQPVGCNQ